MTLDHALPGAMQYQKLFQTMLDDARRRNDGLDLTADQTAQIRGRIALLKELLALPERQTTLDAQAKVEHRDL